VKLVQFHPSYTYEDFSEGYRPKTVASGQLSFELRPGWKHVSLGAVRTAHRAPLPCSHLTAGGTSVSDLCEHGGDHKIIETRLDPLLRMGGPEVTA